MGVQILKKIIKINNKFLLGIKKYNNIIINNVTIKVYFFSVMI